jgi:hypothetical protein
MEKVSIFKLCKYWKRHTLQNKYNKLIESKLIYLIKKKKKQIVSPQLQSESK